MLGRLRGLTAGTLCIRDADGEHVLGGAAPGPEATVSVHDPVLWTDLLGGGVLGAGEAYVNGAWTADDLPSVVRVLLRNRPVLATLDGGLAALARPALKLAHRLQRNSRSACRKYIAAHYDLGNEFFATFLDESMTYSAALYTRPGMSLAEAQAAKYEALCRKLALAPGMRVLEIGCGWGGFAEHAARHHGVHVTGTTISARQLAYARQRIAAAGLEDQVELLSEDYRDLRGLYDRVVSIEMVEAIGHRWLGRFARVCGERLREDGALGLQAITIDDREYERARKHVDFIKRYVFPGSFIPSVNALHDAFATNTDMRLLDHQDLGLDYATTLETWRARFLAQREAILGMGFDEAFVRLWDYYFAYCEGGFRERVLADVQMVFARPRSELVPPRQGREPSRA